MVLNPFLHRSIMDLFDERILAVLNDGKPRVLAQLLGEVGFSRKTLNQSFPNNVNHNCFSSVNSCYWYRSTGLLQETQTLSRECVFTFAVFVYVV